MVAFHRQPPPGWAQEPMGPPAQTGPQSTVSDDRATTVSKFRLTDQFYTVSLTTVSYIQYKYIYIYIYE